MIGLGELAGLDVVHGPRQLSPATYDAWLAVLRELNPRFEFTDPGVPAVAADHPGLRGEYQPPYCGADRPPKSPRESARTGGTTSGGRPGPNWSAPGSSRGISPTAAAALVWGGDLPRLLQQVLFDTADSVVF